MKLLACVKSWLSWILHRRQREMEMEDEVLFHLQTFADDLIRKGSAPEEATRRARLEFGGVESHKDAMRNSIGLRWWDDFCGDLRFAARIMVRNPAFSVVAVLSLAVGIGVNSTLFSLADALVLRPLSVAHPAEVVTLVGKSPSESGGGVSYPDYRDFRDRSQSFDGLVAFTTNSFAFAAKTGDLPDVESGMLVSGNFFHVLGVEPDSGRGFRPDEDEVPGRDAVVVLGHDFWGKHLGADPTIIGRSVTLNGIPFTVIGVAPKRFTGTNQYLRPAMFVPLMMFQKLAANPDWKMLSQRDDRELEVKGRLKPGVSLTQARAELVTIAAALQRAYPVTNRDQSVALMTEMQVRTLRDPSSVALLAMLMTLAALVLLVSCANLANLLLCRARARSGEIAIRLAIGAGRTRLIRQLMAESLAIGLAGCAVSLPLAVAGVTFLSRVKIPSDLPLVISIKMDQRAMLFSVAASVLSVVFFGLVPAVQASRADLVGGLKTGGADRGRKHWFWGRNTLVAGQVALSLVLMMTATMLYRGFQSKLIAGPGFRTDHLLLMSFDPELAHYKDPQIQQFYQQLTDSIRSLPGVRSAALTEVVPTAPAQHQQEIVAENYYTLPRDRSTRTVWADIVGDGYFQTMGIPVLSGRSFDTNDSATAPKVAIVNEVLARHYWPNQNAIGKHLRLNDDKSRELEIVGVANASTYLRLGEGPTEFLYLPLAQNTHSHITLLVQTSGDAMRLVPALRDSVRKLDASLPIYDVRAMSDFYEQGAVGLPRMINQVVGAMGLVALVLTLVGLYGLMSYSVARRTREIGIRMAIGANRASVVLMILCQGLTLILAGLAIGIPASFAAEKGVNAVFSSTSSDPFALVIVVPLFLAVTMLAVWLPARRAARVDPVSTLRNE
jgi:macrolide transport system ATP-binding/permease protein